MAKQDEGQFVGMSPAGRAMKRQAADEWAGYDPEKASGVGFIGNQKVYENNPSALAHTPPPDMGQGNRSSIRRRS